MKADSEEKLEHSSCLLVTLDSHGSNTKSIFHSSQYHHRHHNSHKRENQKQNQVIDNVASIKANRSPYSHGKFCLMPGGDFPTRKGTLDALMAGCIPVTFQKGAAQHQWKWHWGSEDAAEQATHYIPRDDMMKNPELEFQKLLLLAQNSTFLNKKYHAMQQVKSRLQYNVPGSFSGMKIKESAPVDAVDVVLEHILHHGGLNEGNHQF